jgi:hypothetical protein
MFVVLIDRVTPIELPQALGAMAILRFAVRLQIGY